MAVPPRSFAVAVFRFFLVGLLASVALIGTAVLTSYILGWIFQDPWDSPQLLSIGTVCAMVIWLFVAVFHLRRETQTMPFSQREQFIARAKTVLQEMGYALVLQRGNVMGFRPRFHSYLFGGGIHVSLEENEAKLTGPKVSLEIFRRSFRLVNHVQRVQMYLQDQRKFTDNLIKRAELQMRLRSDQLDAVRKNIIAVLEKDGEVVCELNLLVQSENGVRENVLESDIREWLDDHDISVEIHKDLVQFVEVVHPERELEALAY